MSGSWEPLLFRVRREGSQGYDLRAREIGIRLSLGATRGRVMWNILKQSFGQIGIGLAIGVLLALALVRTVASLLPATATAPGVYSSPITRNCR